MRASGELSVVTTGNGEIPKWCADSWAVERSYMEQPTFNLTPGPSGWKT
jgi:hypothetical protein